ETLYGVWSMRLPPGAIVAGFEVRAEEQPSLLETLGRELRNVERVVPAARPGQGGSGVALEWAGPDRVRVNVPGLAPGKTRVVRIRYVEWLARHDGRRTWVYPMGSQQAPLLGEFSLEVDTGSAAAFALEAGMDARIDQSGGSKVVL